MAVVAAALVALVVPPVRATLGDMASQWDEWTHRFRDLAAEAPERRLEEQRRLAGSESLLLLDVDGDGAATSLALLSRSDDADPVLALIPPQLFALLPGYGEFPLSSATVFEGPELVALALENALGVRIDGVLVIEPGELAAALGDAIEIDLPSPLLVAEADGTSREVAQPGPALRSGDAVEMLLDTRGASDELAWLERQAAVWTGVVRAMGARPDVVPRLAALSDDPELATGILARATEGEPQVTVIPVDRSPVAGGPDGFTIDAAAAEAFVERRMGHLRLSADPRPRVEILNGNGRVLTTRTVAEPLIRRGFYVIKTDNAESFDFERTLVIAQGREHRADAERVLGVLNTGELLLELRAPSGVVDVSIIVGHDIPAGEDR